MSWRTTTGEPPLASGRGRLLDGRIVLAYIMRTEDALFRIEFDFGDDFTEEGEKVKRVLPEPGPERTMAVAKQSAAAILENRFGVRREEIVWDDDPEGKAR